MKRNSPQEGGRDTSVVLPDLKKYSTAASQRSIIFQCLKESVDGLTTFDIRVKFDIPHPGARVMELRNQGHEIVTVWDVDSMPGGHLHRVARYVLMPEVQGRLF